MSMEYIRYNYGVPAKRGAIVEYMGMKGVITGSLGARLRVRIENDSNTSLFHPTYCIKYLDENGKILWAVPD